MRRWLAAIALATLAACHKPAPEPERSRVAIWEISDAAGVHGWIMGTVHALPTGTRWRRAAIDEALQRADRLVLEIGQPLDSEEIGRAHV